jgi:hypothetical protein
LPFGCNVGRRIAKRSIFEFLTTAYCPANSETDFIETDERAIHSEESLRATIFGRRAMKDIYLHQARLMPLGSAAHAFAARFLLW